MVERDNAQWLADLRSTGEARENALADLHRRILAGLPYALSRWLQPGDPRLDALAEETAQETLLRVLNYLDTFEGRSKFTTWVHKIAVRVALTELRRKRWENVSLEELVEEADTPAVQILADTSRDPEGMVMGEILLERVQRIIAEDLTEKQRMALVAVAIKGMPLEEVARRMGTKRNAIYKMLHDARRRLKNRMAEEGILVEDVLSMFENR